MMIYDTATRKPRSEYSNFILDQLFVNHLIFKFVPTSDSRLELVNSDINLYVPPLLIHTDM